MPTTPEASKSEDQKEPEKIEVNYHQQEKTLYMQHEKEKEERMSKGRMETKQWTGIRNKACFQVQQGTMA